MKEFNSNFAYQIIEYCEYRKSLKYSETHMHYLKYFDEFCNTYFNSATTISPSIIKAWFDYERNVRPGCLRDSYFSINGFLKHFHMDNCVLSPAYLQRKPASKIPYIMSEEELYRFFKALNNAKWQDSYSGICLGVMLRLIYSSVLRPNEARMLKCSNVNLELGEVLIENTKRHSERIVVLSNDMVNLMKEYDTQRNIISPTSEYFFVHSDGRIVTQAFLWRTVDRCWKKAMFGNKDIPTINPYSFRHQFASTVLMKWLDEGKDLLSMIPYLKAYMGHSHYSSTVYYIHILPKHLLDSKAIDWKAIDKLGKELDIWEK